MLSVCPGWNELLIAGFSHRSTSITDGILLATGVRVQRDSAHSAGVGVIFDRVLTELVAKMRDMNMDKTELGCLRAVVLFNPGTTLFNASVWFFLTPVWSLRPRYGLFNLVTALFSA